VVHAQFSLASQRVSDVGGDYRERLALANDELARLVRRLRSLSRLAWLSRRGAVETALVRLGEIAAFVEKRTAPTLPIIADHALADAMAVIGGDAIAALEAVRDQEQLAAVTVSLRTALEATR
jgi:hypothetical protein